MIYPCSYDHKRKEDANLFTADVQAILGQYFFTPTPLIVDRNDASDLELKSGPLDIAVRMRTMKNLERYPCHITFRSYSNGFLTELEKVRNGKATHMFYGFGNVKTLRIQNWSLLDLNALRSDWDLLTWHGPKSNLDGTQK